MPILVTCKCGKKFRADEKHAGKQKPCPKCGQPLDINGPQVSAYDVFVSYSSKDKATCDALVATFERKGMRCWIAPRDILPGMNWGEAIIGGIEHSRVMVLVFSAHSNESPQVKREVERAVSKGIPVIPLRIEDVKLSRAMEYFISSQHWLDALTPPLENHLEELARKVMRLLSDDGSSATGPGRSGPESIPKAIPVGEWTAPATDPFSLEHLSSSPVWPASPTSNDPSPQGPNYLLPRPTPGTMWTRIPLVWRWLAVGGAAALFVLLIFNFLRPSDIGTIKIDIPSSIASMTVKIDGETFNASQLSSPLRLKVGEHRLEVAGKDIESENKSFKVVEGENQTLVVDIVSAPPAPKTTPAVVKSQAIESVPTESETAPTPANHDAGKTANGLVSPTASPSVEPTNAVASEPAWTDLISGQKLTGWTPVASNGAWNVKNGVLSTTPGDGWLATDRDYSDFELELEYKIPPNGNTGVFLRAPLSGDSSGAGLLEVQAIDDKAAPFQNEPDFKRTGAVWGLFGGNPRADAPTGNWNKLTIRAVGPRITVVVNGTKVTEGNLADEPDAALKPNMKLSIGRIGLQRRDATGAEFRNIRIRDLSASVSLPADLEAMQGVWTVVAEEFKGVATPLAEVVAMQKTLTVSNDRFAIERSFPNGTRGKLDGTIQLAPDTSPKQFNWSGTSFDGTSAKLIGLYELLGDTLKIVYEWQDKNSSRPRPLKFESADGTSINVITFKRTPAKAGIEWTELFNGSDLTGWTAPVLPKNWEVRDGALVGKGNGLSALFANETYDDFELDLEFKVAPGSNSGIWFRAPNNTDARFDSAKGAMSISLLDDASPVWAKDINDPSKRTGGLHGIAGPDPQVAAPAGTWNRLLIHAVGPRITVKVNGSQVLEVNTANHVARLPEYTGLTRTSGYIGLEDHGEDGVEFRNIRIRKIQPAATNANASGADKSAPSKSRSDGTTASTTSSNQPKDRITTESIWSTPVNLGPEVNSGFSDSQPAISADGLTLVFVSLRSGGKGGWDLWMTERMTRNEPFVAAANLQSVNTAKDETQPRLSSDRLTLAYSIGEQSWYSVRTSLKEPFSKPRQVTDGKMPSVRDHAITGDGLARFTSPKIERPHAQGEVPIDLCLAMRDSIDGVFGSETPLGSNVNGPAIDQGPSVTADGQILVFHSNRQGAVHGESAYDIWMATRIVADVDRRAAEWVQSVKGFVEIQVPGQQSLRRVGTGQVLPSEEFRVVKVNLYLNPNTSDAGMANLHGLKAITGLNLGGAAKLSRQGLLNAGIAEMLTLQDLGINAIGVDGTILEQIGKLTKLKSLWLDGLNIGDGSLQHIRELKALTLLSLWGTSVTDAELSHLHGMTGLKTLRLGNTKNLTADGIKALQNALPNCKVEQ